MLFLKINYFFFFLFSTTTLLGNILDFESEISLFSGQVNVFTGEYIESSNDLTLNGPYPLTFQRIFTDLDPSGKQETLTWQFNHPGIIAPDEFYKNNYQDGFKIKYELDTDNLLSSIRIMNRSETKTFHEACFSRSNNGFLILKAHDEREVKYRLSTLDPSRTKENILIDEVIYPDGRSIKYSYRKHPLERKYLISKLETSGGAVLETEYYDNKYNNVGGELITIENPLTDFRIGRVKQQKAHTGKGGAAQIFQTFFYEKTRTIVKDALGNKKIINFSDKGIIQSMEWWEPKPLGERCIKKIKVIWPEEDSIPFKMKGFTVEDCHGNIVFFKTFFYDQLGNLLQESIYGNLSGQQKEPIKIDDKGVLTSSSEKIFNTFRYSIPDEHTPSRLVEKIDDKGLITRYLYNSHERLSSVLLGSKQENLIRRFFFYDNDGLLIKSITDDGQGDDVNDFAGLTERKTTTYKRRQTMPGMGLIEEEIETATDLQSKEELFIKKIKYDYDSHGNIILQEFLSQGDALIHRKICEYDLMGRVVRVEEKDEVKLFEYTLDGKIQEETSFKSHGEPERKTYTYDAANRLIDVHYNKGDISKHESFVYNALNQKIISIDEHGSETFYAYDGLSRLIAISHPVVPSSEGQMLRPREEFTLDVFGNKISVKDPNGYETKTSYNLRGKPTEIFLSDGSTEMFVYSLEGNLSYMIDRVGVKTEYIYDKLGRVIKKEITSKNGTAAAKSLYSYSSFRLKEGNEWGKKTNYLYDAIGYLQSISITCSNGTKKIDYLYDEMGRIIKKNEWEGESLLCSTITERDDLGTILAERIEDNEGNCLKVEEFSSKLETTAPLASLATSIIDYKGCKQLRTVSIDKNGIISEYVQDSMKRILSKSKKNSFGDFLEQIIFSYDLCGNKISEIHEIFHNGVKSDTFAITWNYGPNNRIEEIKEISGGTIIRRTQFIYKNGLLKTVIKPNGIAIDTFYNDWGNVMRVKSSDNTIDYCFEYDKRGNVIETIDILNGKNTKRTYDEDGLLCTEVLGNGLCLSSSYDSKGRRVSLKLPDFSEILYDYDAINIKAITRLDKEGDELYSHFFHSFDHKGHLLEEIFPKDLGVRLSTYDKNGCLNSITTPYFSDSYIQFDKVTGYPEKRKTVDMQGETTIDYSYDYKGQLISETLPFKKNYGYDALGNRTSENNEEYLYEKGNHLSYAKGVSYVYDECGNLKEKLDAEGNTYHFTYDALDQLIKVFKNEKLLSEYVYDPFHRRIEKKFLDEFNNIQTIKFIYDGQLEIGSMQDEQKIDELRVLGTSRFADIGAPIAIEIHGESFLPIHDITGSLRALISFDSKDTVENYQYSSFGEVDSTQKSLSPWGFSGKRVDSETGFILFGQRYYDPLIGRWLSLDPLGYQDGPNRFVYVANNPIINADPTGLFITSIWDGLSGMYAYKEEFAERLQNLAGLENNLGSEINTIFEAIVGKDLLGYTGYYKERGEEGTYGQGEPAGNVRLTLINGITNLRTHFCESMELILKTHGGSNIHYIFRPTVGWCWDLINGFMIKCGFVSSYAEKLSLTWKRLIDEMGGVNNGGLIIHYCHSLGGSDTSAACSLLTEQERKMIRVFSFGSATMIPSSIGFAHVTNFISMRDGITLFDPVGLIKALLNEDCNVVFAGSLYGPPLIDHMLASETYVEILRMLGLMYMRICHIKD